jgi:hypothetical protein
MPILEIIFPAFFLGLFLLGMWLSLNVFHWGLIESLFCGAVLACLPFSALGWAASRSSTRNKEAQPAEPKEDSGPASEKE